MIKLIDILNEGYDLISDRSYLPALKNILVNLKRFKTARILYRGFKAPIPRKDAVHLPFVQVSNTVERETKGGHNPVAKRIVKGLQHKYRFKHPPVFTSFDYDNAKKFGEPYIFIPKGWFASYQNPKIPDIGLIKTSDQEISLFADKFTSVVDANYNIKDLVDGYKKTLSGGVSDEAILDIKQYYLIKPSHIKRMFPAQLKVGELNTYKQLQDVIEKLIEEEERRIKQAGPRAFASPAALGECITVAKMFDGNMVLGKNRDRNYHPKLKVVRDMTGYGIEVCYVVDNMTDWTEGMNSHGIGIVNSALFVQRDEKETKLKKTALRSKDGVRIREVLAKSNLKDAVITALKFHGGIKGHTLIGDGNKIISIENTSRLKPIVKIKDLNKEPLVRTNHGLEHPEAGYQNGNDKLSSELRLVNALNVLHQNADYKKLFPAFYNHKQDKGPKYDLVRAQNKLWTSSQLLMNLGKKEMILYLVPDNVEFIGVENKLPPGRKPKIKVTIKQYKNTPEKKYSTFVTTDKKPKQNALRK